ncbi:MAG: LpxA family transferase [Chlamydiales bacterium]|nr:LpxA family transferase [Chlamydiales bacterium]
MDFSPSAFFDLSKYAHSGLFEGCEYVWEALSRLSQYLKSQQLGKIEVEVPAGVVIVNPELVSIAKGCRLEPGAYIQGPCIIGENTEVRQAAYIRGNVIVGRSCVVGHATEMKHAVFLDGTHAGHFAYVGDSILGNDVNLGAGVKCANVRLDRCEVSVRGDHQKHMTGLKKFGAIIGDFCQLGCNSVLNPGTIMGKDVACAPCVAVGGVIPAKHRIVDRNALSIVPFDGVEAFLPKKR